MWRKRLPSRADVDVDRSIVAELVLGEEAFAHRRAAHGLWYVGRDPRPLAGLDVLDLEVTSISHSLDPLDIESVHGRLDRRRQKPEVEHLAAGGLLDDQLVLHVDRG